ncbi:ester cyclase [Natrinema ejinorense]|uniref:Ester cyclase n=1 Tax=Natrinema ejinorense TaxID=373386 RepID=A0A2A5QRV9_9EURY|nr:ester cyclase [Natrinema ejinorense]PCR89581.1 hypothetical protein CP557_02955 [Natrinema ejinorense]
MSEADSALEATERWFVEVFNENNPDVIDEIIAEDCTFHGPESLGASDKQGREGARWFAESFNSAWPDAEFTIHDIFTEDDLVAVRWTMTATHEGEWLPNEIDGGTGAEIELRGNNIHRTSNGKLVDIWPQQDTLKMVTAIDAVSWG